MAPSSSFRKIGAAAAVACATAVKAAATESYQLSEEYTAANFFDKFDFFTSTYTSGDSWDDTHGYVQYRGQAEAERMGLISSSTGYVYIGPDANSTYDPDATGRDSVRITSKAVYNEGLMVAKFAHMPVQACGAWPAFWSFGSPWLTLGEIDYYEGWNEMGYNRMALHTNGTLGGECALTTTGIGGTILTDDCVNGEDMTGCGVQDDSGVWGSPTGATFAMEWTDAAIKIWSWVPSAVPADITAGAPDPTAWGSPTLLVEQTNCDLGASFASQQLVFNIDFCGDTAGSDAFWNQTCLASTGGATCASYVANNPAAFAESYFLVEGIQYYELGVAEAPAVAITASAAAAADVSTQAAVTASAAAVTASAAAAAVTTDAIPAHHTTSYIYGTSTATDEFGSETTVVVVVDTTICPITAAEASASSLLASESTAAVSAQTTPAKQPVAVASISPHTTLTSYSTSTSVALTTSTIFSTSASTITSCASTASLCNVGDVTTVVIAVSTTICPVTAAEASASSSVVAPPTRVPVLAPSKEPATSPVRATASLSSAIAPSAAWGPFPSAATAAPAASSKSIVWAASVVFSNPPVQATASFAGPLPSAASSGASATENSPVKATASAEPSAFSAEEVSPSTGVVVPTAPASSKSIVWTASVVFSNPPVQATASFAGPLPSAASSGASASVNSPVKATASAEPSAFSAEEISPSTSVVVPTSSAKATDENSPVKATAPGTAASENSPVKATAVSSSSAASTKSTLSTTTTAKTTSSEDSDIVATAASTEVITATETGGGLELATEKPTSLSLAWLTEVTAAATASSSSSSSGNGTATDASEAAEETNTCSGVDCIVVSSRGSRRDVVGDSGLALVVVAGAMFLF